MNFQLLTLVLTFLTVSCGPIRFDRSYLSQMEEDEESLFSPGESFDTVSGDTGRVVISRNQLASRTPDYEKYNPEWSEDKKIRYELDKKLGKLDEDQQIWFKRNENLFATDSQKIYFLGLSESEREDYLYSLHGQNVKTNSRGRSPASTFRYSPRSSRVIALGMGKNEVVSTWGNPHHVEVAGDPRLENERWIFYEAGAKKFVYFERGVVGGWVTE